MVPKCCISCRSFSVFQKPPEEECKPEYYMAAKMTSKCLKFHPGFSRESNSVAYQYHMEKYHLETEDEA